jgi:hypothetical protein
MQRKDNPVKTHKTHNTRYRIVRAVARASEMPSFFRR